MTLAMVAGASACSSAPAVPRGIASAASASAQVDPPPGASSVVASDPPRPPRPFLVELVESPTVAVPPRLRAVSVPKTAGGYVLEELGADGTRRAWFMVDWYVLGPDLYAGTVRRDELARPGLALWNAAGRVVRLDADTFVATDPDVTVLFATRAGVPVLYELPKTFGGAEAPTPISLGPAPEDVTWSPGSIALLDREHVLSTTNTVFALPSFEPVARFERIVDGIGGRTALLRSSTASGDLAFEVVDGFTDVRKLALSLPTREVATPTTDMMGGGPPWVAGLSADGRWAGFHGSGGLLVADLNATPVAWRRLGAEAFGSFRGEYGLAFAKDGSFVCVTKSGLTSVHVITAPPVAPPGATAVARVIDGAASRPRSCQIDFMPSIQGLAPFEYVNDKFATFIYPSASDPSLGWTAALYGAKSPPADGPSDVELVVFDPKVGKPIHRVVVARIRPPEKKGEDTLLRSLSVTPVAPGFMSVSVSVGDSGGSGTFDLRTGKPGDPPDASAAKATSYCLNGDGELSPAETCPRGR